MCLIWVLLGTVTYTYNNTLVVVNNNNKKFSIRLSCSVFGQWLDFGLGGLAVADGGGREFGGGGDSITTAAPHYGCVVNVGFNVGIEEKL